MRQNTDELPLAGGEGGTPSYAHILMLENCDD